MKSGPIVRPRTIQGGAKVGLRVLGLIRDFKFVPLLFVPLGFGFQMPLLTTIVHGLGAQNPRVQTIRVQRKLPEFRAEG